MFIEPRSHSLYQKEITLLKVPVFYFNSYEEVIKTCKLWGKKAKILKEINDTISECFS